jgi:hypothetical protein
LEIVSVLHSSVLSKGRIKGDADLEAGVLEKSWSSSSESRLR